MPNLNSKHKLAAAHGGKTERRRICLIGIGAGSGDDHLVEGVEHSVGESCQQSNDDGEGEDSSQECAIFGFFFVSQQLCGIEEVCFVDEGLES